jgi:hypothetical protein
MNRHHSIRPAFVKEYHVRNRAFWDERLDIVKRAEASRRALNQAYCVEGSARYHGPSEPAYERGHKEISAEFDRQYQAVSTREREWLQGSDMTIPECLFLDNFSSELATLCDRPGFDSLDYFSLVEAKAQILLESWKTEFNYRGMSRRVERELQLFRYARKRCWKHFDFRLWDIDAWKQARLYRSVYARNLREGLNKSQLA